MMPISGDRNTIISILEGGYMTISGITSGSVAAAYSPPPALHQSPMKAAQQAPKTDTVTISKLAQQLASDGDPAALEAQESSAEKAGEAAKGKI
jgi:hypothetical protein